LLFSAQDAVIDLHGKKNKKRRRLSDWRLLRNELKIEQQQQLFSAY